MAKRILILLPLFLAALACSLSGSPSAALAEKPNPATATATRTQAATLEAATATATATRPPAAALEAHPTPTATRCTVRTGIPAGALNVRACAGMACPVLVTVHEGDRLTVLESGGWSHIQTGPIDGWINSKFCEVTP